MRKLIVATVFIVTGFLGASRAGAADLLLAAASDAELQPVLAAMTGVRTEQRAAWQFWTGELAGKSVVLTRTEGDPLNAVAATTLAIRRYAPKLVVTFGASRAHDPALQAGDVVVSEKFAAHDGMISPHLGLGEGSDSLKWIKLQHPMMTAGEKETRVDSFPADPRALAVAKTLAPARGKLVVGVPGSAHQVNREADRVAFLRALWGTSSEDGESAHVAGCAQLLGVPAIGLRVIEGNAGEAAALAVKFVEAWK